MQEAQLLEALQQLQTGDRAALETLYRHFSTPIYTVILRMTGDTALSEDILQEFFVKLYTNPPQIIPAKPRAYLFRMAHNLTIDHLRTARQAADLADYAHTIPAPAADLAEKLDLERAMTTLTPEDRALVTLHVNGGLKFREAAEVIGLPLGTVLWRYRRAIDRLRELLKGDTI